MSKKTDDDLREDYRELRGDVNDLSIQAGINKWIRTICVTATLGISSGLFMGGQFCYQNFNAVKAGILAFLAALHPGGK